jgi:hypothetical protein
VHSAGEFLDDVKEVVSPKYGVVEIEVLIDSDLRNFSIDIDSGN